MGPKNLEPKNMGPKKYGTKESLGACLHLDFCCYPSLVGYYVKETHLGGTLYRRGAKKKRKIKII